MGDFTMSGKGDTKDVSKASHLEGLETTELADENGPALRSVEEGWTSQDWLRVKEAEKAKRRNQSIDWLRVDESPLRVRSGLNG